MSPWVMRAMANNLPAKVYTAPMQTTPNPETLTTRELRNLLAPMGWTVERYQYDAGERVEAAPPVNTGRAIARSADMGDRLTAAGLVYLDLVKAGVLRN